MEKGECLRVWYSTAMFSRSQAARKDDMINKRVLVILLLILVLAIGVMIFLFSAQSREQSSRTSIKVVNFYLEHFYPNFQQLSRKEQSALRRQYNEPVRKAAHGFEFMLLGTCLYLFLHGVGLRFSPLFTWVGGTLYAVTDEWHQTMVSGRGGMWQDVCIDSGGVIVGILIGMGLLVLFRRLFEKPPQPLS